MTMFKFRRGKQQSGGRNNPEAAAAADDDDEPMTGTSFKYRPTGGSAASTTSSTSGNNARLPAGGGPGMRNYAGNTRNKHAAGVGKQQQHGGVSWISDTNSETDVTDTWTTDYDQNSSSSSSSSGDGSSSDCQSSAASSSGDASSAFTSHGSQSASTNSSSAGYSEYDENTLTSTIGHTSDEEASYSSVGEQVVVAQKYKKRTSGGASSHNNISGASSGLLFDASSSTLGSVGPPSTCAREHGNASGGSGRRGGMNSGTSSNNKPPPPPPNRKGSTGTEGAMSMGEQSVKSTDSRGDSYPGNPSSGKQTSSNSRGSSKSKRGDGLSKSSSSSRSFKSNKGGNKEPLSSSTSSSKLNNKPNTTTQPSVLPPSNNNTNTIPFPHHNHHHHQPLPPQQHEEQSMKLKPPSMKGMPTTGKLNKYLHKRSSSSGDQLSIASSPNMSSGATVATTISEGNKSAQTEGSPAAAATATANGGLPKKDTEVAAMQQLAYLVVSLRSDLREANMARDEMEIKLEKLEASNSGTSSSSSHPYSDNNAKVVQRLEKENANLQSDVDAFILEQDDLRTVIKQLEQDKSSLNDMISRLKGPSSGGGGGGSSASSSSSPSNHNMDAADCSTTASYKSKSTTNNNNHLPEQLQSRIHELTDENHKLEREIQLLVTEKSELRSSSASTNCEIEMLHKNLKESEMRVHEKDVTLADLSTRVRELMEEVKSVRDELRESTERGMILEDALDEKRGEVTSLTADKNVESKKMTLLRQRLSQVEKQKGDLTERTSALDHVMLGLKKKMEECLKERNSNRQEIQDLKIQNANMEAELKQTYSSNRAVEKKKKENEFVDSDTLLSLQKMIASLEESKSSLEEDLDKRDAQIKLDSVKISQLQTKLNRKDNDDGDTSSSNYSTSLRGTDMKSKVTSLEHEKFLLQEELDGYKSKVDVLEEEQAYLEEELDTAKEDLKESMTASSMHNESCESSLGQSNQDLSVQNKVSLGTIQNLQKMIASLEETKDNLEEEMNEATDAIAMLEDELDSKDAQVKELLIKLTMLQQQFSQSDKCKTALAERNAVLASENDDFSTQIKVLIIEKKIALEQVETLKTMKEVAEEDAEDDLILKQQNRQEVDGLIDKLEDVRSKSNKKVYDLEQQVTKMEERNVKLEEDLEESSDAIAMLREALTELEEGKGQKDSRIKEMKSSLNEKESALTTVEAAHSVLQQEHQVSVETISNLQKMIKDLETTKDELEEELNLATSSMVDLKDTLKNKNTLAEVTDLENKLEKAESKLKRAEDKNSTLNTRIGELTKANDKMKEQVKELGDSLAKVTASHRALSLLPQSSSSSGLSDAKKLAKDLVSSDPLVSCDALISEVKDQIKQIVSSRNAALEEVEFLKSDGASGIFSQDTHSTATIPPPRSSSPEAKPAPAETMPPSHDDGTKSAPLDDSVKTDGEDEEKTTCGKSVMDKSVMDKSVMDKSIAERTLASRGSSMLEAAKKLCNQLDEKRSKEESVKINSAVAAAQAAAASATADEVSKDMAREAAEQGPLKDNVLDIDDNVSAREVKEDSPPKEVGKSENGNNKESGADNVKKDDINRASSRSKGRFDIDQLTSIYFEKCGMSVSRFSDLSSDSSTFRRRAKAPSDTVTKKVKICRNGVFMGTYEGDLNTEGQRHGFGVLLCDNGNSYEGEWKKDKRDGLGIARYSSGDVYDGQWQRGKRQGHGVMYIEAGDTYIGSWNNGLKHGAGTYHWADGEVDVSWYQEDRRVGEGVRWNAGRSKAYRLIRGTKKEELSLDEAYTKDGNLYLLREKWTSIEHCRLVSMEVAQKQSTRRLLRGRRFGGQKEVEWVKRFHDQVRAGILDGDTITLHGSYDSVDEFLTMPDHLVASRELNVCVPGRSKSTPVTLCTEDYCKSHLNTVLRQISISSGEKLSVRFTAGSRSLIYPSRPSLQNDNSYASRYKSSVQCGCKGASLGFHLVTSSEGRNVLTLHGSLENLLADLTGSTWAKKTEIDYNRKLIKEGRIQDILTQRSQGAGDAMSLRITNPSAEAVLACAKVLNGIVYYDSKTHSLYPIKYGPGGNVALPVACAVIIEVLEAMRQLSNSTHSQCGIETTCIRVQEII